MDGNGSEDLRKQDPYPLLSWESQMFDKENPDRKKTQNFIHMKF